MTDLIKRLRGPCPSIPAMRDAADEIERLREWKAAYESLRIELTAERHEALLRDAARYRWLRCGGWEILQNPKYWTPENKFDGAVDAAMLDVGRCAERRTRAR